MEEGDSESRRKALEEAATHTALPEDELEDGSPEAAPLQGGGHSDSTLEARPDSMEYDPPAALEQRHHQPEEEEHEEQEEQEREDQEEQEEGQDPHRSDWGDHNISEVAEEEEEEEEARPPVEDDLEEEDEDDEAVPALSDVREEDEVSEAKGSVVDSLATTATVFRKVNNGPSRQTMVGTLSVLYAIFVTSLGVVLPLAFFLSGRLRDTGLCFALLHIYVSLTSIVLVIYLSIAIWRFKGKDRVIHDDKGCGDQSDAKPVTVDDNGYVIGQDDSPSPLLRQGSPRSKEEHDVEGAADSTSKADGSDVRGRPYLVAQTESGVNCLLRLGLIAFGMGSMMLDGFRLVEFADLEMSTECIGLLFLIFTSLRLLFTFVQTFFLFKNHRIGLNFHKAMTRFAVLHLMATNLCMWAMTVIMESANRYARYQSDQLTTSVIDVNVTDPMDPGGTAPGTEPDNSTQSTPGMSGVEWVFRDLPPVQCYQRKSLATEAAPYLFPCGIEYSLLAVAILCRVYSNIGRLAYKEEVLYARDPLDEKPKSTLECHKANTGLFLGLALFTLICITTLFFLLFETGSVNPITETITALVYFGSDITVSVVSLIALAPAFAMMRKLHFSMLVSECFNQNLMFVSAIGYDLLLCLMVVPALMSIYDGGARGTLSELQAIACILAFVQSTVQIIFIFDGLRRRSMTRTNFRSKPGRSLVTFLLICNVCMWVIYTFELKEAMTAELFAEFYGSLAWVIIMHVGLPLGIFFRFHSSVCLSDIWVNAYKRQRIIINRSRSSEKRRDSA